MPSETDCLNDALSMIGASPITGIDDGSVAANHCQRLYPALRDSLIRAHHWNFAMRRVELAQDVATPPFEFTYQYTLPSDCLKLVEYNGTDPASTIYITDQTTWVLPNYRVEGRTILTNDATVFIVYLARIINPDLWDGLFYQLVATWLASKLAAAINHDAKMSLSKLEEAMKVLLPIALASDGQEGSVQAFMADDLLRVR